MVAYNDQFLPRELQDILTDGNSSLDEHDEDEEGSEMFNEMSSDDEEDLETDD